MKNLLARIAAWLLEKQYVGKTAYCSDLFGARKGKFISAGMQPETRSFVLRWVEDGQPVGYARPVDVRDTRWDLAKKAWVFDD